MEQKDRNQIKRNINLLIQPGIINYKHIRQHLLELKIFTLPMIRDVDNEDTEKERVYKLLMDLCTRGPLAFHKFIKILKLTQHNNAVGILAPNSDNINFEDDNQRTGERSEVDNYVAVPAAFQEIEMPEGGTVKDKSSPRGKRKMKLATDWIEGEECYKMSSAPRGLCFILNNVDFTRPNVEKREGSSTNAELLVTVFKDLGYRVDFHKNKTAEKIIELLKGFASRKDHCGLDSCVVILMSHGARNVIHGIDCEPVCLDDVYKLFNNANCEALINRPKIFIINSCRGEPVNYGAVLPPYRKVGTDSIPFHTPTSRLPTWTDMLLVYCTVEGCNAARDEEYGSWFMHYLINVLMDKAWNTDLYTMIQETERLLQQTIGKEGEKQSSESLNRGFSKKLYFNPGLYK